MTELLTKKEFKATVQGTRIEDSTKNAAYRVLVEGDSCAEVAKDMGVSRQLIHAAAKKIKKAYDSQVEPEGCRMVKVWLPFDQADKVEARCRKMKILKNS